MTDTRRDEGCLLALPNPGNTVVGRATASPLRTPA